MMFQATVLNLSLLSILALLSVATSICFVLKTKNPQNPTVQKVWSIAVSWWYIALPVLLALFWGPYAVFALFLLLNIYALIELISHSLFRGLAKFVTVILIAATLFQYGVILVGSMTLFYSLIPLLFVWLVPLLLLKNAKPQEFPRVMALVMGSLLVSYYLSHVPALVLMHPSLWRTSDQGCVAILVLIFTTELNDVLQFLSGKSFGRRKIVPEISPNKTEAGFIGGILGTTLVFAGLGPALLELTWIQSVILGCCISITGILGDLTFSASKRYFGVKDFSDLLPGHGGLLDRLDSLILTAPVYFHLLYFFQTGIL